MSKKLKLWNGSPAGRYSRRGSDVKYSRIYVCAYNVKHAAELLEKACACYLGNPNYFFRNYMNDGWGVSAKEIDPEVGVWASSRTKGETKIERVL